MQKLPLPVRYIWDVLVLNGKFYLATGDEGQVLEVAVDALDRVPPASTQPAATSSQPSSTQPATMPQGVKVILDTEQNNVLCLAVDATGRLLAGVDEEGLVYRVDFGNDASKAPQVYVVLDADEPEIGALLTRPDGTVYVGTAAADESKPGRMDSPAEDEPGELTPPPVTPTTVPATAPATQEPEAQPEPTPAPAVSDDQAKASTDDQADAADDTPQAVAVTGEMRDRLRDALRAKLLAAREGDALGSPDVDTDASDAGETDRPSVKPAVVGAQGGNKSGNAVYRIDDSGFVTEVFRDSVTILSLLEDPQGRLLIGTGDEGEVYRVDESTGETTVIATLEAKQLLSLTSQGDAVLVGASNPARLQRMTDQRADEGTYTSPVMDAGQVSLFGVLRIVAAQPEATSLSVQTRSGNVADPDQLGWSNWSAAEDIAAPDAEFAPARVTVTSPPARFLQYRITFSGDGQSTATLDTAEVTYIIPNLPPQLTSVSVDMPEAGKPGEAVKTEATIKWQAEDPNEDDLLALVEFRPAGTDRFITLAEDQTGGSTKWDTRLVPEGRYIIRVTVRDTPDNPPGMVRAAARLSSPVLIDHGRPEIQQLTTTVQDGKVTIAGTIADDLSPIASVDYAVNDDKTFRTTLPDDLIFDSTSEPWSVTLSDLTQGPHVITLRITDRQGQTRYQHVPVTIP